MDLLNRQWHLGAAAWLRAWLIGKW